MAEAMTLGVMTGAEMIQVIFIERVFYPLSLALICCFSKFLLGADEPDGTV